MPAEISSMDLLALEQELQVLDGARIDKFYQKDDAIIVYAYKPGDKKYRLYLAPGQAFLTDYKREMPDRPPSFCMYLRKNLGGKTIERVEQYDFDRILELHTDEHVLICELFRDGNFILTKKDGTIQQVMRTETVNDRELHPGEPYEYPESGQPPGVGVELLEQFPDEDVVIVLASELGMGGRYAEEVCARAGVTKNAAVSDLSDAETEAVVDALQGLVQRLVPGQLDPRVYSDADGPVIATPVPFDTYDEYGSEAFDTFSGALDTYFTQAEKVEYRKQQRKAYEEQKEKLERRLEQQQRKKAGMEQAIEENREKADAIYEHYGTVEDVIETLRTAREEYSADEIAERLESEQAEGVPEAAAIERLDLANDEVVVDLGIDIRIDIAQNVEKNAEYYYEKSKDAKDKLAGVEDALQETERKLENLQAEDVDVEQAFEDKEQKKAQKEWYEKFRWCFSSDGFLIIAGRDTTTNDMLVKKYMEPHDVYVHAEFQGAPSVVIRTDGDADVPEQTLQEAGQIAVTYAKAWKAGVTSEDAYHVAPEQVTQEPESGDYLPKGSFVIRGDRTYLRNLEVSAAVGAYEQDGTLIAMGGPASAVKANCDHYIVLQQGNKKPSDVAKSIQHHLHEATGENFDLDRIIRALPPGKAAVAEKH